MGGQKKEKSKKWIKSESLMNFTWTLEQDIRKKGKPVHFYQKVLAPL